MGATSSRQDATMDFVDFPEQLIVDEQAMATRKRSRKESRPDSGYASGGRTSPRASMVDHNKRPCHQQPPEQEMVMGWHSIPVGKTQRSRARPGGLVQHSVRHVRCCNRPWLDEIQYIFINEELEYDADDEQSPLGDPCMFSERQQTRTDADTVCSRCLDRLAVSVARMGLYDEMLKGAADGKRLSVSVKMSQDPTEQASKSQERHRASDNGPTISSHRPPLARRPASVDVTRWHQKRHPPQPQIEHADPTTYWVAPDWLEGGNLYGF